MKQITKYHTREIWDLCLKQQYSEDISFYHICKQNLKNYSFSSVIFLERG